MSHKCDISARQRHRTDDTGTNINNPDGVQDFQLSQFNYIPGNTFLLAKYSCSGGNDNKTDTNVNISVALTFTDTTVKR